MWSCYGVRTGRTSIFNLSKEKSKLVSETPKFLPETQLP